MTGQWKCAFTDNPNAAQQFILQYNSYINTDQQHISTTTTAPIDEEEDNHSNDSNKPFSFNLQNDQPTDSFTDNPVNFDGTTKWSFNSFADNASKNNDNNETNTSGGFSDINWSFDNKPQETTEQAEEKPIVGGDGDGNGDGERDENNGSKITCKPIVELNEVQVASGHENEELISEFKFTNYFDLERM